jgi:hypothetical protein
LRCFNVLPLAYKHFLSKLSPAMGMEKFWANPDTALHKYKTTDMAMRRLLFSRYLKWEYWVGTSLFNCLETPTKVFVLTQTIKPAFEYLLSHPFFSVREFTSIKTSAIIKRVWENGVGSVICFLLRLHMHCLLCIYICVWNIIHAMF